MGYEFDGKKYEKASVHQKEWGLKLIHEMNLSGTEHILDLGCGDGALTAQLAEIVPKGRVLGIDASQGMIETAVRHRAGNLRFEKMDINYMDFDNEFDFVFSNATLHWIKDHDALLRNVLRSLKKGGFVRFNFAADGNCSNFFKVIREAMTLPAFARYFSKYDWPWYMPTIGEYELRARSHPFSDARVWGENADRLFPNESDMIKWIDQPSLVPFLKHINEADKSNFRSWVIERMVQQARQGDEKCFETFRRINVFARK